MKQVKIGVAGVGRMGSNHSRVLSTIRAADFLGVFDIDRERAELIADQYEVKCFKDLKPMLAEIDALVVACPTDAHVPLAKQALNSGVHVLVEKPLSESEEEAEEIVQLANKTGLVVQVGHIERFNPAYRELKNLLMPVKVLAIDSRRLSAFAGSNTDVDVIFDLLIHDIDLVLDLVGREPHMITAVGVQATSGSIDHVVSHLNFEGGPLVTMTASRVTEEKIRRMEITAVQAFIEADLLDKKVSIKKRTTGEYINHNLQGVKYRQESVLESIHVPSFEPLFLELQHFIECITDQTPTLVPAEDGLRAVQMGRAIREKVMVNRVEVPSLEAHAVENSEVVA